MFKWMTVLSLSCGVIGFLLLCLLISATLGQLQGIGIQQTGTGEDKSVPSPSPSNPSEPQGPYVQVARAAALEAGLPPELFVRQIQVESGFNPRALSPAGAQGIAQFMPATAAGLGINPWNPEEALKGAARLMASYVKQYQGDYARALAAYNAGTGAVQQAITQCQSTRRQWEDCLPLETQHYIQNILS